MELLTMTKNAFLICFYLMLIGLCVTVFYACISSIIETISKKFMKKRMYRILEENFDEIIKELNKGEIQKIDNDTNK